MKRGLLLVAVLLLTACGSGGVGSSVGGSTGGGGTGTQANVTIVVNHTAAAATVARSLALAAPTPTRARIVITNQKVNGLKYKLIQDITLPGTTTLTIPAASGYTFELVTYVVDGTINRIIEYAATQDVQILQSPAVNTVTLTLDSIKMGLTVPDTLTVGQTFSVIANFPTSNPLHSIWALSTQTTNFTLPLHLHASITSYHADMMPPANNNLPATIYFQGEFFLKPAMLNTNESYTNWPFVYPNPLWETDTVSAPLIVPSGVVTITIP